MVMCSVFGCSNSKRKEKHLIFHIIPKDENFKMKWWNLCKRSDRGITVHDRICSRHFKPTDYARDLQHEILGLPLRKHLLPDAVPSLHLPVSRKQSTYLDLPSDGIPLSAAITESGNNQLPSYLWVPSEEQIMDLPTGYLKESTVKKSSMKNAFTENISSLIEHNIPMDLECDDLFGTEEEIPDFRTLNIQANNNDDANNSDVNAKETLHESLPLVLGKLNCPQITMAHINEDIKKEQNQYSDEFPLGKWTDLNIKQEDINDFVKEEHDLPPTVPTHFIAASCPKCVMLEKEVVRLKEENCLLKENQCSTEQLQDEIKALKRHVKLLETGKSMNLTFKPSENVQTDATVTKLVLDEGPSIKDDPDMPSQSQGSSEFLLGKGSNFNIKDEEMEEVDFDEVSCCSSAKSNDFKLNAKIGTEKAEEKRVKSKGNPRMSPHCNRKFSQKGDLRGHLLTHSGEKPHGCPHCNKRFSLKGNLNGHLLIHTGEKPHGCLHCNKKFSSKQNMKKHLLTHSGEKPHECLHCSRKFCQKRDLQRHILTHTGEKPHGCLHCNKKFSLKQNMRKHLLTHSGGKPHECLLCSRKFCQKRDLQRHLLTHSGHKPLGCPHCNKKFSLKQTMKKHLLTHTGRKS